MNGWGLEKPLGARKCVQLLRTSNADQFWRVAIDKSCPILLYTNCRKHRHAAVSSQSFVTLYKVRSEEGCLQSSPVVKASATLSKFIETMNFWSIFKPARHPNWVQEKTKIDFFLLIFFRGRKNLRVDQNTEGHHHWVKIVGGVVIAKLGTGDEESNAAGSEYLNRKRPKCNFWHLIFFRPRKNLRVIRNIKWHHDWMKTVGGVVIAKSRTDRTEIEGDANRKRFR